LTIRNAFLSHRKNLLKNPLGFIVQPIEFNETDGCSLIIAYSAQKCIHLFVKLAFCEEMDVNPHSHPVYLNLPKYMKQHKKSPHDGEIARGAAGIYIIETSGIFKGME
jgi:hypothetical protein